MEPRATIRNSVQTNTNPRKKQQNIGKLWQKCAYTWSSCGGRHIGQTSKVCLFSCFHRQGVILLPLNFSPVSLKLFLPIQATNTLLYSLDFMVNNIKKNKLLVFILMLDSFHIFDWIVCLVLFKDSKKQAHLKNDNEINMILKRKWNDAK